MDAELYAFDPRESSTVCEGVDQRRVAHIARSVPSYMPVYLQPVRRAPPYVRNYLVSQTTRAKLTTTPFDAKQNGYSWHIFMFAFRQFPLPSPHTQHGRAAHADDAKGRGGSS